MGVIGTILMVVLAPLAAMVVQMAVSRTREYAADRMGAEISGQPLALAGALARIEGAAHGIENDTAERNPASAHMFIINPLSGARMDNLFSTHPATENRIAALQELARQMGASASASGMASAGAYPAAPGKHARVECIKPLGRRREAAVPGRGDEIPSVKAGMMAARRIG